MKSRLGLRETGGLSEQGLRGEALATAPFVELPLMKGGGAGCQVIAVIPELPACSSPGGAQSIPEGTDGVYQSQQELLACGK